MQSLKLRSQPSSNTSSQLTDDLIPVEKLGNGERRGARRGRGDPVQSSLPDVDEVNILMILQENKRCLTRHEEKITGIIIKHNDSFF